ncbi:uncharacterized protein EV154DRAFT_519145 [Mucor mucedo]|uniref:uncharacterized protein n=1 Tax=Mucor mucedo TaxID=29922 RepID=UPI0022204225|nr:uncharacterized protein EV154DRAFT_519145 [Mucor mucedo]KAI7887962.1 hypothetical protein EV154DRAFT_519145 [Mucor mucedo]
MLSIDEYLGHVHRELSNKNIKKVLVSGNDSADLDSIISSLLFAYLSHTTQESNTLYIPIVKVPKGDLELRPELKFVLTQVGLDYRKLVTIDMVSEIISEPTDIVLIDHNQLTAPFATESWSEHVVGVLDHHVDEGLYTDAPFRVIQMVGSCVTLVLQHFQVKPTSPWLTQEMAHLAVAPLLVDTVNLKWDLGRTTESDVQVFGILQHKLELVPEAFFKSIEKVKSQVDSMNNYDILRRDYKEFPNVNGYKIGTSAVTWHFRAWVEREGGAEAISQAALEYAKERELDMEVIFTAFDHDREGKGGDYRRELAVFVVNPELMGVKESLETNKDLQLKPMPFDSRFYEQGNIKMSRKQVWPLLKQLVEHT